LNGGRDVLTFLAINPKVLQSPKVNPLLRMALTKEIMETKDFDIEFFKFFECFLSLYGESSLFQLFGFRQWQPEAGLQYLKNGYTANFEDEESKDNGHWAELADAIFQEFNILDTDDLFYKVYLAALKIKSYLLKLDVENKIYPQYQKAKHLGLEAYYWLLKNPSGVYQILKTLQNDTFWDEGYVQDAYNRLLRNKILHPPTCADYNFWGCFGRLFPSMDFRRDFTIPLEKVFKLEKGDDGRTEFVATQFFRNYRKTNKDSFFKLDLDFLHPEAINLDNTTNVGRLVDYLEKRGGQIWRFFYDEIRYSFKYFKQTDLDMFGAMEEKAIGYLTEIQEELKK